MIFFLITEKETFICNIPFIFSLILLGFYQDCTRMELLKYRAAGWKGLSRVSVPLWKQALHAGGAVTQATRSWNPGLGDERMKTEQTDGKAEIEWVMHSDG